MKIAAIIAVKSIQNKSKIDKVSSTISDSSSAWKKNRLRNSD